LQPSYRYGFNTQEKVDEISGAGNHTTAMFWEYDTRLGRRWNRDPVVKPWESSYACLNNSPIRILDPNGDDGYVDEDGNSLGDDGDKKSHETRVINKDVWKTTIGENKDGKLNDITDATRKSLQTNIGTDKGGKTTGTSKLLAQYEKGINISDETWKTLTDNGGTKLTPFVINESDKEAWYKSENDDLNPYATGNSPNPIAPKTSLYSPIDGLATHKYKDAVYKVTTGSNNIRIMTDGDIKSSKHWIANDGWIDWDGTGDFIHWFSLDKNWNPLYEKAKSTGGSDY